MPVSSQTANDLMTVFSNTVTAGFASLAGPVNGIFGLMIALVVALTGIQWAVSANRDALAGAFSKILLIGAFAYIINDWQGLSETVFAGFMAIGLQAGGGGIGAGDFLNPGAVIETGWGIVKAIGDAPTTVNDPLDVIGNLVDAIIIGISMLGIMIAFAILALQIIVTLLEFKIVTLGGFILLPFGIFSKTSFMAERPLGYVVAAGLKVLALAIIVSGAQTVFAQLIPSPEPDIYEALTILTAAIILAMLSIFAPNLTAALVSGGPALGAGALSVGGLAVGAAGGAAIAGTMVAGGAAAGAASKIASSSKAAAGAAAGKPPSGPGPSGAASSAGSNGGGPRGPSGGGGKSGSAGAAGSSGASATGKTSSSGLSGASGAIGSGTSNSANSAPATPVPSRQAGPAAAAAQADQSSAHASTDKTQPTGAASSTSATTAGSAEPAQSTTATGSGQTGASSNEGVLVNPPASTASATSGAASSAAPSASGPQRYHRFPERASGQQATRARAFNAFWTANAARQLMPANENGGSLNPSIREED
jgi:type IV secretion system protein TrbL